MKWEVVPHNKPSVVSVIHLSSHIHSGGDTDSSRNPKHKSSWFSWVDLKHISIGSSGWPKSSRLISTINDTTLLWSDEFIRSASGLDNTIWEPDAVIGISTNTLSPHSRSVWFPDADDNPEHASNWIIFDADGFIDIVRVGDGDIDDVTWIVIAGGAS